MNSRIALLVFRLLEIIFENSFWKRLIFWKAYFGKHFEKSESSLLLELLFMEIMIGKFSLRVLVRYFYKWGWTASGRTCQNRRVGVNTPFCNPRKNPYFFENAPTLASSFELTRLLRNTRKTIHASSRYIREF